MQSAKRHVAPSCLSFSAADVLGRFDPRATLRMALDRDEGTEPRFARDCLLIWVLGLPEGVDARRAAAAVLPELAWPERSPFAEALRGLLAEVANCSRMPVRTRRRRFTH